MVGVSCMIFISDLMGVEDLISGWDALNVCWLMNQAVETSGYVKIVIENDHL